MPDNVGMFSVTDVCPSCQKSCKDMALEHSGKVIHIMEMFIVCTRCGTLFLPRSRIKHVFSALDSEHRIINPASPEAQKIVQQMVP